MILEVEQKWIELGVRAAVQICINNPMLRYSLPSVWYNTLRALKSRGDQIPGIPT